MKSILNLKKNISSSTNTSKLNGISPKDNKSSPAFYLISVGITNLCVYLLCSATPKVAEPKVVEKPNYSEIVLPIELKTPFKSGKLISIYDTQKLKTYSDIYFLNLSQEENQVFEMSEKNKVVLYVPNKLVSKLTQAKDLVAIPYQSIMDTKKKIVTFKENYEINY